jgi:16S rRNA (cytidine1402-2'-O)-methyltransferase
VSGRLTVCPTPIGNLGDVTLRVLEELRSADVIACEDTRRTHTLCAAHDISTRLLSLHEHNEDARAGELVERIASGERVALVSDAGMPLVSDPGARLVAAVLAAGFEVDVLPGASAVTTAIAASGLAGGGFVFAGFLPRAAGARESALERLDAAGLPLVVFESPRRLQATLRALAARDPNRCAAVCRELTKLHQQVARGTVAELAEQFSGTIRGEVTLVLAATHAQAAPVPLDALSELAGAIGVRRAAELGARLTGAPRNQLYRALTGR